MASAVSFAVERFMRTLPKVGDDFEKAGGWVFVTLRFTLSLTTANATIRGSQSSGGDVRRRCGSLSACLLLPTILIAHDERSVVLRSFLCSIGFTGDTKLTKAMSTVTMHLGAV